MQLIKARWWCGVLVMVAACEGSSPGPVPVACDVSRGSRSECEALCAMTCGSDFDCCYVVDDQWQQYEASCGACDGGVDTPPPFQCADDSLLEPNDAPAQAFITPIPAARLTFTLVGLAICPAADQDHFAFGVDQAGINFEATVTGVPGRPPLAVDLRNSAGTVLASGTSTVGAPHVVTLAVPNRLAVGNYVVQIRASDATENNYDLTLKECTTPLPCP